MSYGDYVKRLYNRQFLCFLICYLKSSFVRLQLNYNSINLCLIKITTYNYNHRARTMIDSTVETVGVPYTVRSFIIYDNDVTLTLT